MVRIVKEYAERCNEFLDVAQALFYSKGYEQTSVQEIIDRVGVSKGTFYHYFGSKGELLDALVERMTGQVLATLEPMVADESLNAVAKMERFFARLHNWKADNRDFFVEAARVLYQDENVLLRNKVQQQATANVAPLLAQIIHQGVAEGVFDVTYPEATAEIVFIMGRACGEAIVSRLLADEWDEAARKSIEQKLLVYERSIERVLGAPHRSICLIPPDVLDVWLPEQKGGPTSGEPSTNEQLS